MELLPGNSLRVVNLNFAAKKFAHWPFLGDTRGFSLSYIILFNWCLTTKFAKFNRMQNFVDLQC